MWKSIVSVPDHCLFIYVTILILIKLAVICEVFFRFRICFKSCALNTLPFELYILIPTHFFFFFFFFFSQLTFSRLKQEF